MSVIKFELKKEHVLLLKNVNWSLIDNKRIVSIKNEDDQSPFGGDDIYDDINLIINGKPDNLDVLNMDEPPKYTEEQKLEWDKIINELPIALDLILYTGSFELGMYKTRWHLRKWEKIK